MKYKVLPKNAVLLKQGAPSDRFFIMKEGNVHRKYLDPESGREQTVEYAIKARSINSMKILSGDPVFATVKCVSDECKVFEMLRTDFLDVLQKKPQITTKIAEGLCEEIRTGSKKYATPLLEQHPKQDVNIPAVSIAAGIESYYRSALNSILNARLTGGT
jgi:CRP-like cAMP-binding protein